MALETLKNVEEIGGFKVVNMDTLREKYPEKFHRNGQMLSDIFESEIRGKAFIYVRDDKNSISFNIQNGPIKEYGVNGCQVDTMIETAKLIIEGLNEKFPCDENMSAIAHLDCALNALFLRKSNREKRGVEGLNKA